MNQESERLSGGRNNDYLAFECNICLDVAQDAVVSLCGHLFCWPCLHQWLYTTDSNSQTPKTCPVCKSAISREKTIPIYGRGGDESTRKDPRDKLPPRPHGQRTEVPNEYNLFQQGHIWSPNGPGGPLFGFGEAGFHMYFGVGSLPQFVFAFLQEYASNESSDTDFFFMKFFAICGMLCILMTLYFS